VYQIQTPAASKAPTIQFIQSTNAAFPLLARTTWGKSKGHFPAFFILRDRIRTHLRIRQGGVRGRQGTNVRLDAYEM